MYLLALTLLVVGCEKDEWLDWKVQNQLFLEQNRKEAGVIETASGLQYRVIRDPNPTEAVPHSGSTIIAQYTLRLPCSNDVLIESALASITISETVDGFQEGIKHIHNLGEIEMWLPYDLGYGEDGTGTEGDVSYIPPYSTLYFRVEVQYVNAD